MLDQTELDVVGSELRVPFASFALVFTDRHMLSLAERLLASSTPRRTSASWTAPATSSTLIPWGRIPLRARIFSAT
jgi:hypothetical protein